MGDFVSLYTAFSGLQAAQAGMDTASHNVANAGTDGYTRQRVGLASRLPHQAPFGQIGTGVDIDDISRVRNSLLDARVRSSIGGQGRLDTLAGLLGGLEAATGEPDHGITASLGGLWSSFEELALDPPDAAARTGVLAQLDALARHVRSIAGSWSGMESNAVADIEATVAETNRLVAEVARLNQAIAGSSASTGSPNDLMDQRDVVLDQLSRIAGVTVSTTDAGHARVSLNGLSLVHDYSVSTLSFDTATNQIIHSSGSIVRPGGELAGHHSFLNTELPKYQAGLNQFAEDLAAALNTQHASGFTQAGAAGGALLGYTPGDAARSLTLAITDPADLAVASTAGPPVPEFDGTNAEALAGVRNVLAAAAGTITLDESFRALVTELGAATASAISGAAAQGTQAAASEAARTQVHGVSVDEEMVNLLTYQRAYEAAARVMTAVDEALDTLINRTGLVGR
ncbi:MAG: flagellar hook-associated protein FlgK [Acidimicrobiia bacterium]|nr:flagellar hook-associated protein FlgK [Acidimicrobiia bacterium]